MPSLCFTRPSVGSPLTEYHLLQKEEEHNSKNTKRGGGRVLGLNSILTLTFFVYWTKLTRQQDNPSRGRQILLLSSCELPDMQEALTHRRRGFLYITRLKMSVLMHFLAFYFSVICHFYICPVSKYFHSICFPATYGNTYPYAMPSFCCCCSFWFFLNLKIKIKECILFSNDFFLP